MSSDKVYKTDAYSIMGLLVNLVGTTAVLFIASTACEPARQDGWMVPILATLYGAYVVYIVYRLGALFPEKSFIEYLPLILGKAAGKVLGALYILFFLYLTSTVIRETLALFYGTGAFKLTPPIILAIIMMVATTYGVFSGFEVISRTMSIYWLVIGLVFIATIFLALPYMKWDSLLPFGEAGVGGVVKGSIVSLAYWGELFLLAMILPYAKSPRDGLIAGIAANLLLTFFTTAMVIAMVTVLGVAVTTHSNYALFFLNDAIPPIGIKVFLLSFWVIAFWGKIMLLQYMITQGTAQLLNLKSYHYIVLPFAVLLLVLAFQFYKNIPDMLNGIPRTFPGVALFFEYLIPTLLLIIASIKARMGSYANAAPAGEQGNMNA